MSKSAAANNPTEIEPTYQGETRNAQGYDYWTTNQEDEESLNIREQVERGEVPVSKKKKPRRRLFKRGIIRRTLNRLLGLVLMLFLAAVVYVGFNYLQVADAEVPAAAESSDAIVVLGAPAYDGAASGVMQERLDHAFNLYSDGVAPAIVITGAGTVGEVEEEGLVGLEHLLEKDVPASDIVVIPEGSNTWEQVSALQLEELNLESVLLVADGYQTYRLLQITDDLGIDASLSPSAIQPMWRDNLRESLAVSIGRITGYSELSAFTGSNDT